MRAVLFAFAAFVWAGAAHAQELMSARAFRDAGIARIQELSPDAEIEIRDDLGINVRVPDKEGPYIVNSHNSYALYRSDPGQRDELISPGSAAKLFLVTDRGIVSAS